MSQPHSYTAFVGHRLLVAGPLESLLSGVKTYLDKDGRENVLIFEDQTGKQVEFDFEGTLDQVLSRELPEPAPTGPGRPKLGVTSREISLLPRHWEWLEQQPQGISAALRRLVEETMKREPNKEKARRKREAAAKLMWGLCGDLPGFEEASRALYAKDLEGFEGQVRKWPKDARTHLIKMLRDAADLEQGRDA